MSLKIEINPTIQTLPPKIAADKNRVVEVAEPVIESTFLERNILHPLKAKAAKVALKDTAKRDQTIFLSILTQEQEIDQFIGLATPLLLKLIPQLKPDNKKLFKDEANTFQEIFSKFLRHLLANLASVIVPKGQEKLTATELFGLIGGHLIKQIGLGLDQVDAMQGEEKSVNDFKDLAGRLLSLALPDEDPNWGILFEWIFTSKEEAIVKIAGGLFRFYVPGENQKNVPQEELKNCGLFLIRTLSQGWLKKDNALFQRLTGEDHFYPLVQRMAPSLTPLLINLLPDKIKGLFGDAKVDYVCEALVLRALAFLVQKLFKKELAQRKELSAEHVIKTVLDHLSSLFKSKFESLDQEKLKGKEITAADFNQFSLDLIKLILPQEESNELYFLVNFIERRQITFLAPISESFFKIYQSTSDSQMQLYKERLKKVFRMDGAEAIVNELFSLCHNSASKGVELIRKHFFRDSQWIAEELQNQAAPCAHLDVLAASIRAVFKRDKMGIENSNTHIEWLGSQIPKAVERLLFKCLVNLLETVPEEKRTSPERILAQALKRVLKKCDRHFSHLLENFNERVKAIDEEPKKLEIAKELMHPFLKDLMGLFFNGEETLESQFPFPEEIQKKAADRFREGLLNFFGNCLITSTRWIKERENNKERLKQLYNSDEPAKLCHALGEAAEYGLPHYLREEQESIAAKTIHFFKKHNLIDEPIPLLKKMVQNSVGFVGNDQSDAMRHLFSFIGSFIETALLKIGGDFSDLLKIMEDQSTPGELVEKALEEFIQKMADHFAAIVQAKKALKKNRAAEIKREQMVPHFQNFKRDKGLKPQNILHPAAIDEEKRAQFFVDWAKNILKIVGVSKQSKLPLPDAIKGKLFELFEKTILPKLLVLGFNQIKDPHKFKKYLLSIC